MIAVSSLSRQFGAKVALDEVSVFVPRGSVLGLVGENGAGKTTLIKHLLDEVERIADYVVMLQRGRVVLNGRTEEVRIGHISAVLAFEVPPASVPVLAGAHAIAGYGVEWRVLFGGSRLELETAAARIGARVVDPRTPTLDEILVARAGGKAG